MNVLIWLGNGLIRDFIPPFFRLAVRPEMAGQAR